MIVFIESLMLNLGMNLDSIIFEFTSQYYSVILSWCTIKANVLSGKIEINVPVCNMISNKTTIRFTIRCVMTIKSCLIIMENS